MMPRSTGQTNKLLGYPAEARLLIVNADDFGMCHAINEATIQALTGGIVTSCSLMVPCPWAGHALAWLQENPATPFGVHLTAVSEQPLYRWGPVLCRSEVPSLVDEAGYFYAEQRIEEFLDQVDLAELEREFRAQIEAVLVAGLQPTHLDSHCSLHSRRASIFEMTFGLAQAYGLARRVEGQPYIDQWQQRGYATNDHPLLDSYRLETTAKSARYAALLHALPAGLSEWAVHPGLGNAELQAAMPSWPVRQTDFEFVMSAEAQALVQAEAIILGDYTAIQTLWNTER